MTTITIELTDEQAHELEQEAMRLDLTLEAFVTQTMQEVVTSRKQFISQAIDRIIRENAELYRRLA